jgi:hypothetical protein
MQLFQQFLLRRLRFTISITLSGKYELFVKRYGLEWRDDENR